MKLYHWTERKHLDNILEHGLKPKMGIIYLTEFPQKWENHCKEGVLLRVETGKNRLTCFENYKDGTEILCWGRIPPKDIEAWD